jgi:acyl-homoserine-lactone acylase
MSYGNSSQPGTAHRSDQLNLLSEKRFRQLWLTRADVERNLEKREGY